MNNTFIQEALSAFPEAAAKAESTIRGFYDDILFKHKNFTVPANTEGQKLVRLTVQNMLKKDHVPNSIRLNSATYTTVFGPNIEIDSWYGIKVYKVEGLRTGEVKIFYEEDSLMHEEVIYLDSAGQATRPRMWF
jgi:hypothetical protein